MIFGALQESFTAKTSVNFIFISLFKINYLKYIILCVCCSPKLCVWDNVVKAGTLSDGNVLLFVFLFVCLFVRLSRLKRVPVMVARAYYVTHLVRTDLFVVLSDSCFQAVHQPPPCKVTGPIHLRIMLLLGNFCWTLLERLEQQVVLQRRLSWYLSCCCCWKSTVVCLLIGYK